MYASCLFCNRDLGRNESLETFPIGTRLAFDPEKGRLWVVCKHCERWNLSPLEERWEAIETAERFYRDTRRRVSTDEIGLAKLRDGTELVRIGRPMRPEFAAWRYGDQFGRRRTRQMLIAGGGVAAIGVLVAGGAVAGVGVGSFGWLVARGASSVLQGSPESVVAKIRTAQGELLHVRRRHLGETTLSRDSDGSLLIDLRFKNGHQLFVGREAERIASIVVPKVNRYGGSKAAVAEAVQEIEAVGGAEAFVDRLSRSAHAYTRPIGQLGGGNWWQRQQQRGRNRSFGHHGLFGLPAPQRLALEMALHEESERRALQGELAELERAWREAEEIAGISDNLLLPGGVLARVDALKKATKDEPTRLL
ncbi:MAG: hypothetical protein JWM41_1386 [Gemmatimonadetes bacterium]|nr:hypothetical protein [Gemmatimonadota bacterium]